MFVIENFWVFDVAAISKIHFNVIFSNAASQNQQKDAFCSEEREPQAVLEQPRGNLYLLHIN
jgi:hypothetical protein